MFPIKLITIILIIFLSSCTESKLVKNFNSNIKDLNAFDKLQEFQPESDLVSMVKPQRCMTASLNMQQVSLVNLADTLSKVYNVNVNSLPNSNDLKTPFILSIKVNNVCLSHILDHLTDVYNVGYEENGYGYNIYAPQIKTRIFSIDYHNFYRDASSAMSVNTSQLSPNDNTYNNNNTSATNNSTNFSLIETKSKEQFWDSIEKTLQMIVLDQDYNSDNNNNTQPFNTQVSVYRESGLVVIKGLPKAIKNVEEFLKKVNKHSVQQVVIEAKVLEIQLNDEFQMGVQWELLRKKLYLSSFNASSDSLTGLDSVYKTTNLTSEEGVVSTVISSKLSNRTDFDAVIQALSTQGKISVLSSPRIAALNNQRALIKFGDDRYYVTNVSNISLDNLQTGSATQSGFDLEPFFSGIALDTMPNVINDHEVLLHIHPIITRVDQENKLIQIDNKNTKIPVAKIQTREADTVVKSHSGDIIIIGGMIQNYVELNNSGLPIESKGVFNKLFSIFSAKHHSSQRIELIILLRPTIVKSLVNEAAMQRFENYIEQ